MFNERGTRKTWEKKWGRWGESHPTWEDPNRNNFVWKSGTPQLNHMFPCSNRRLGGSPKFQGHALISLLNPVQSQFQVILAHVQFQFIPWSLPNIRHSSARDELIVTSWPGARGCQGSWDEAHRTLRIRMRRMWKNRGPDRWHRWKNGTPGMWPWFFSRKPMVGLSESRVYLLNGHEKLEKWGKWWLSK